MPAQQFKDFMADQLEQELRRLIVNFVANVRIATQRAALRSVQSAFAGIPDLAISATASGTDALPLRRPASRRTRTADELASVRAQLATLIRDQPGQSTAELARAVGIPGGKLRPQLRQLAEEGVIRIEERVNSGLRRHIYLATEPLPGHRAEPPMAAGAAA
jgi:hypothetical protein